MSDQIDPERLARELGCAVEYYESIDSTQSRAHALALGAGRRLTTLILADAQTAGRGRGTNRWWTGKGSLAMSLLVDPQAWSLSQRAAPGRSLAVAVAIVDTVAPLLPGRRVGLNWPNDVYVENRKLAGVLVDVLRDGLHVIGVGVNVNNSLDAAPDDIQLRATSLNELTGREHDRTMLAIELISQIKNALVALDLNASQFGGRFDKLCLQRDNELAVDAAGRQINGICEGVAADGALILRTARGEERVYSGRLM